MGALQKDHIRIAIAKGRVFSEALPLLERIGLAPVDMDERKLILNAATAGVRFLVTRSADVPAYVVHGAAELGIVGTDVLMECNYRSLYQPLDLGIARCRMVLAGLPGEEVLGFRPRIATKYVETARNWFSSRGQQAEVIRLYGSMELAPLTGLADQIIDLVDTGETLRKNGLVVLHTIAEISARLVINRAQMKLRTEAMQRIMGQFESVAVTP